MKNNYTPIREPNEETYITSLHGRYGAPFQLPAAREVSCHISWDKSYICDPFWENLPKHANIFFPDLLYSLPFTWCIIQRYFRSGFDDIAT